jgi:hypothetical protein
MNILMIIGVAIALTTLTTLDLVSAARKKGFEALLLKPYISITLLHLCQLILLLCMMNHAVETIKTGVGVELILMYAVMHVMIVIKTVCDKQKIQKVCFITSIDGEKHA